MNFQVLVAGQEHYPYAQAICDMIEEAAKARGTGIAKREAEYVRNKMEEGKAIIALEGINVAGFCYIETWDHGRYVANSGLIVSPNYRHCGLAKKIKKAAFELSRQKYPDSKLFGITTSLAVMKINSELGYKPVTFSELTTDEVFWKGCQSCPNFDILQRNEQRLCLCTGMMFDPAKTSAIPEQAPFDEKATELKSRWERYKQHLRRRDANKLIQRIRENFMKPRS
ncbi:GNAT family N-acetyltransferase [Pontibacter sp. G13]|uniref:GNAT family N-acetyltransferase n=1 Tax=Pontibacter sp. G13 TaxID=3074898 RepID=UPI00288B1AF1|nr:GNAT family N-acetyltransferase [Pontibacter sp. G13]WNJ16355.1 GNAT family N-acetyltransferase [Pontibacter sp. G13]